MTTPAPKAKSEMFYGLLTVRLENPPAGPEAAYKQIKSALGLSDPVIDDDLGAIVPTVPFTVPEKKANEEFYIVGVDNKTLWDIVKTGHPNVVGCMHAMAYTGGNPPLHLKDLAKPPVPPKTNGGPRRNPHPKP